MSAARVVFWITGFNGAVETGQPWFMSVDFYDAAGEVFYSTKAENALSLAMRARSQPGAISEAWRKAAALAFRHGIPPGAIAHSWDSTLSLAAE